MNNDNWPHYIEVKKIQNNTTNISMAFKKYVNQYIPQKKKIDYQIKYDAYYNVILEEIVEAPRRDNSFIPYVKI